MYAPLAHAPWHGLTPTDLVFPFFLFAVGNAMAFVMPRLEAAGDAIFWRKVLKRTAIIFLIGLFLNWWPFVRWQDGQLAFIHWVNQADPTRGVRIMGVLQRIALCYFFASVIIYYCKMRKAFYIALLLMLLYWLLCYLGNPSDPYSLKGWFGTDIDRKILGTAHLYKGEGVPFDPEGLMTALEHEPRHACGGGPMVAILHAARQLGASTARILRYADSGDISGDKSSVVGYLAAAVF